MGDMADFFNEQIEENEMAAHEYLDGNMSHEEAFDRGFIEPDGSYSDEMHNLIDDRPGPQSLDTLNRELYVAELELKQQPNQPVHVRQLTSKAVQNLKNSVPTCNCCHKPMKPRNGKHGKFYFCACEGQKCVSDTYWQSVRR